MKINWKLRLQNKTTLLAIAAAGIALVYQILGLIGVVSAVSQDAVMQTATMVVNLLALLGIVVDPTTAGTSDSTQALGYDEPRKEEQ